jgi:hypothetical protein
MLPPPWEVPNDYHRRYYRTDRLHANKLARCFRNRWSVIRHRVLRGRRTVECEMKTCCEHHAAQLPNGCNDMRGLRFAQLTVKRLVGKDGRGAYVWECLCDCGRVSNVRGYLLRTGRTKSCGCLRKKSGDRTRTHGMSGTTTYNVWRGMIQRCQDPARKDYYRYGGAGVTVCERWQSFNNFLADMGERPEGLTLDRIDNAKGYSPDNCRWATPTEQVRNSSAVKPITIGGHTQIQSEWLAQSGVNTGTLWRRLARGWPLERALTTPPDKRFDKTRAMS